MDKNSKTDLIAALVAFVGLPMFYALLSDQVSIGMTISIGTGIFTVYVLGMLIFNK